MGWTGKVRRRYRNADTARQPPCSSSRSVSQRRVKALTASWRLSIALTP